MMDASSTTSTITTTTATTTTSVVTSSSAHPNASIATGVGSQTAASALSSATSTCTAAAIADAFDIFDHSGNRTIDVRELGTVLRYLGYVPSQADLRELAVNVEDHEATGTVHLAAFLPYVENAISEYKYQPASASELLSAFRALDPERIGTVSRECMESALRHDGEPFEDEELEEMMSVATIETAAGGTVIPYELYINKILVTKWDTEQYGSNTTTITTTNSKISNRK
ncbi:dynein regulatory complex protein 8-like [Acyrthosiphon pisum]|uniref:EF-hand domain-containing protein n=1 Tax=Acyrthosiphon pisum TaxID=7029 RepID=A0A8R2A871_ACYPI|nr:dynein regulatory complex protein 8-like [Acyrthosiphon pisum]|eukprot:XP_001949095.4 PREDICTED: EF-hand calcium-binding domain-containing protein 2-like [Acyrthosiphon pisum]